MSYSFYCSKCKVDHAGECVSRKPRWRWTTNFSVPRTYADVIRNQKWVAQYVVPPRAEVEVRLGRPIRGEMSQACDDPGHPETSNDHPYPMGAVYIPFEVWVEWQMNMGVSREAAERFAAEPPMKIYLDSP